MDFLFETAFRWGGPVTWVELIGDASTLIAVICVARQVIWNWPLSLMATACLAVFFVHIDLPANACLQGILFLLSVWGWFQWRRRDKDLAEHRVRHVTRGESLAALTGFLSVWTVSNWFLGQMGGSEEPTWDSCTFALGVIAIYGQAKKLVEAWFVWIVLDLISVPLFWNQDGRLTAALFTLLAVVSSFGLRSWIHDLHTRSDRQHQRTP